MGVLAKPGKIAGETPALHTLEVKQQKGGQALAGVAALSVAFSAPR